LRATGDAVVTMIFDKSESVNAELPEKESFRTSWSPASQLIS
jgi:hypothetical protein